MKVYRGSGAAARNYLEAGRSRADDYYLAEGTGIAERYRASATEGAQLVGQLSGDGYESWVQGNDPVSGAAKGRLRNDSGAVRFVEVVVNGPKSWSLAAELHPQIAAAYEAAQDRAAVQILDWLAAHATTRVGPRGAQVQVPVQQLEAAVLRHYTSRAGDPHRHLHLQVNARVLAEGKWRGLHTVGIRDSLDAMNGIGHAAVVTDPGFRIALAVNGFSLGVDGEIEQLREFVGPFSARAAQVARNLDGFETVWRSEHPGEEPGPALKRAWATLAWAKDRPDKVRAVSGEALNRRWLDELADLGYRPPRGTVPLGAVRAGELDRDGLAETVLSRLAARRSAWNAADVRGEAEQALARTGLLADAAIRLEVAEGVTARAVARSVQLVSRAGVPEHLRTLTSAQVIEVEADLTSRIAARTGLDRGHAHRDLGDLEAMAELDAGQRDALRLLAGDRALVVVEGAAGAGKTSVLAETGRALAERGDRLVVITPTLKAARVAADRLGSHAGSAAWLIHQHGYRCGEDGDWTRLHPDDTDPVSGRVYRGPTESARLRPGDLVVVDEAGMLDQDTARALFTIADEHATRLALIGDRRQLPAVGRGGVLDLAARWTDELSSTVLDAVHRFADPGYAELTLKIRAGEDPGAVFDDLNARGLIRIHPNETARTAVLADQAAQARIAGTGIALAADTRQQVAALNTAVRERLVTAGPVDDTRVVVTAAGERVGVGDRVATRRNDPALGVANRDTWTITGVDTDGALTVQGAQGTRALPAAYVHDNVELAYATTVYGVQGDTTTSGHLAVGDQTTARSAYVGMTRGRDANTAHLVARTAPDAREQWVAVFDRTRADLGPTLAAQAAHLEVARYAPHRPLPRALGELRKAWAAEERLVDTLTVYERRHEEFVADAARYQQARHVLPALEQDAARTAEHARQARQVLDAVTARVDQDATRIEQALRGRWDVQRPAARQAATTIRDGDGLLHQRHRRVQAARDYLEAWTQAWQPVLTDLTANAWPPFNPASPHDPYQISAALGQHAHTLAVTAHPELAIAQQQSDRADSEAAAAERTHRTTRWQELLRGGIYSPDQLHREQEQDRTDQQAADRTRHALHQVRGAIGELTQEPVLRSLPPGRLDMERNLWHAERAAAAQIRQAARAARYVSPEPLAAPEPARSHGISR